MKKEKKSKILNVFVNSIGIFIFALVLFLLCFLAWPYIGNFIENPKAFQDFVSQNGLLAIPLYLFLQILQVVAALIPGEALELGAGFAFGWFWGFILAEIGAALGTALIIFVCRKFGKGFAEIFVGNKLKFYDKLNNHPKRDAFIFFIFLIPALPKDLLCYCAAFFNISLWKFVGITAIARIPSIISSTLAADFLLSGDYLTAALLFAATALIAIICFFLSEKILKKFGVSEEKRGTNK